MIHEALDKHSYISPRHCVSYWFKVGVGDVVTLLLEGAREKQMRCRLSLRSREAYKRSSFIHAKLDEDVLRDPPWREAGRLGHSCPRVDHATIVRLSIQVFGAVSMPM
jgi:hypothetical protein